MDRSLENENAEYTISIEKFQGPFELLHQLIEKRKLQINTISLAEITNDYIAYLDKKKDMSIDKVSEFVHIASILILIKSKSLLPVLEYTKEEEIDINSLKDRMELFSRIKSIALPVFKKWKLRSVDIVPPKEIEEISFSPDASCNVENLHKRASSILNEISFLKATPKKSVEKTISIEQVIDNVLKIVTERISVSFRDISTNKDKTEKIVSFLAILELIRNNLLEATQKDKFDDILISKCK